MAKQAIAIGFAILWLMVTGFFLAIGFWGGRKVVDRFDKPAAPKKQSQEPDMKEAEKIATQLGEKIHRELNSRSQKRKGVPLA